MARRTILLSEVNLTEESVNLDISGNLNLAAGSNLNWNLDTILVRDAANALALKNGTTAQEFKVYGTTTGAKYASVSANANNAVFAGVGSGVGIVLEPAGGTIFTGATDNTVTIGSSTARSSAVYTLTGNFSSVANGNSFITMSHNGSNGIITVSGGVLGFGTQTTSAGLFGGGITGYISIVDITGVSRRLAVVT